MGEARNGSPQSLPGEHGHADIFLKTSGPQNREGINPLFGATQAEGICDGTSRKVTQHFQWDHLGGQNGERGGLRTELWDPPMLKFWEKRKKRPLGMAARHVWEQRGTNRGCRVPRGGAENRPWAHCAGGPPRLARTHLGNVLSSRAREKELGKMRPVHPGFLILQKKRRGEKQRCR